MPSDREPDKAIIEILTTLAAQARAEGYRDGIERAAIECDVRMTWVAGDPAARSIVRSAAAAIRALAPVPDSHGERDCEMPGSACGAPACGCES